MIFDATPAPGRRPRSGIRRDPVSSGSISSATGCTPKGPALSFPRIVSAAGWVDYETLLVASDIALHRFDMHPAIM
jgi:hypothetical protein